MRLIIILGLFLASSFAHAGAPPSEAELIDAARKLEADRVSSQLRASATAYRVQQRVAGSLGFSMKGETRTARHALNYEAVRQQRSL